MSWLNSLQHGAAPPVAQGSSPTFDQQQIPANHHWQQQNYNTHQQAPPSLTQPSGNNWYNPATPNTQGTRNPQQNWQQPPPPDRTAVNNFQAKSDSANHQAYYNQQQQQQLPPFTSQPLQHSNVLQPPISQSFIKTEQMSSQVQANDKFDQHHSASDGWSDWDWNENNQPLKNTQPNQIQNQRQHQPQPQPSQHLPPQHQSNINNFQNFNQNVIEDSFSTETNDNWNWNIEEKVSKTHVSQSNDNYNHNNIATVDGDHLQNHNHNHQHRQQQQQQQHTLQSNHLENTNPAALDINQTSSLSNTTNSITRIPDEIKDTQQFITNPLVTRVKKEHQLTPQWSTESQMSNTSSERSVDSNDLDSRSTNTSDEHNSTTATALPSPPMPQWYDQQQKPQRLPNPPTNFFSQVERNATEVGGEMDSLDQALLGFSQQPLGSAAPTGTMTAESIPQQERPSNINITTANNMLASSTSTMTGLMPQPGGKSPAFYTPPTAFHKQPQSGIDMAATPISSVAIVPSQFEGKVSENIGSPPLSTIKTENNQITSSTPQYMQPPYSQHPSIIGQPQIPESSRLGPVANQLSSDNNVSTVSSPVYVSQAKPVAQPPRQYAMTPAVGQVAITPPHPAHSVSPGVGNLPPPPPSQTPPQHGSASSLPPPPPITQNSSSAVLNNPYKRAGLPTHHRGFVHAPVKHQPHSTMPAPLYAPTPEEFQTLQQQQQQQPGAINQEFLAPDNSEIITDRIFDGENQELAPNNDRNQYLQTGHLAEDGFNIISHERNSHVPNFNDFDNFPPPGLSRLVLGQPESESNQNTNGQPEIPPGLDRMIPGTEVDSTDLNMERHADGQDTMPSPRSAFTATLDVEENLTVDITSDRNLYLVPGESDIHEHRVVTGIETGNNHPPPSVPTSEQREVELDGENLEDRHQQQNLNPSSTQQANQNETEITREDPIEGANTLDLVASQQNVNHETESSITLETNRKDHSNPSTCNDDSDNRGRHVYLAKTESRRSEEKRRRATGVNESHTDKQRKERYETEESDYSSDRERRRYREGSAKNDRDKDIRERERRERREGSAKDRERCRDDRDRRHDRDRHRDKYERDRGRYNNNRYETDSKYETESSTRYDRRRGGDRERDPDYNNRRDGSDKDRKYRRGDRYDREDRDRDRDRRHGERGEYRGDRRRDREQRDKTRTEYDDDGYHRRSGSRNARDSDREKEVRARGNEKDQRYQNPYGYPQYGYDPYAYYQQQQQYYEQLRRTNPQAYAEWYRKYFSHVQTDLITASDGRESVHSGRSSANNEKDRYSLQAIQQYYQHTNEYHRNFGQSSGIGGSSTLNSTSIMDQSNNLSAAASTGNLSLSQQQIQQQQQQFLQHQQQNYQYSSAGYLIPNSARSYYTQSDFSELRTENLDASLNLIDGGSSSQEPQRLTPCKYTNDHSTVSLSSGLLVCVKPKYSSNGVTNIVKVLKLGANDSTRRLFQSFPGPLVRGLTHKKTIIEFCEDQIRLGPPSMVIKSRQNSISSISSIGQANKASFTLMWNLLILLLRQNGMVVGTDIAELLIKNKMQYPYGSITLSKSSSLSRQDSNHSDLRKSKDNQTPSDGDGDNKNDFNDDIGAVSDETDSGKTLPEDEITEKFRNYLLYGNVNEALDWATENNLWGHALFLASKLDRRSHANIMMKFANKLELNDPLQTLYQLMSGRTPSSVTSVQDEKWGDWRPHLAMILSNTSQRPELDRRAITTLGDSLYNRGDLFGAQFCYLMAQVGFCKYSAVNQESTFMSNAASAVRLVLLGSSHHKNFREFATNEAIMMTEIYEYACALNDDKFSIIEFQPYKYLLATRMLDYGFQLKTLMYMEQITSHIQRDAIKYEPTFIEKVYKLADQLKYFDPVLDKTTDDPQVAGDNKTWENGEQMNSQLDGQVWLQDLRNILKDLNFGNFVNGISSTQTFNGSQAQLATNVAAPTSISETQINSEFLKINQQFSELSLQYNNYDPMLLNQPEQVQPPQQPKIQEHPQVFQPQIVPDQAKSYEQISYDNSQGMNNMQANLQDNNNGFGMGPGGYGNFNQSQQQQPIQDLGYEYDFQHQQQQQRQQPQLDNNYWGQTQHNEQIEGKTDNQPQQQKEQKQLESSTDLTESINVVNSRSSLPFKSIIKTDEKTNMNKLTNASKNAVQKKRPVTRFSTVRQPPSPSPKLNHTPTPNQNTNQPQNTIQSQIQQSSSSSSCIADVMNSVNNQVRGGDTPKPSISMPNSLSSKPGFYEEGNNLPGQPANNKLASTADAKKQNEAKTDNKNLNKSSSSTSNSGWFGGIWNKLSLKPKNQMILPDDKNPAIVWDADKKKWVNTDGDESHEESFKPPPKMGDLMPPVASSPPPPFSGHQQQQPQMMQPIQVPLHQQQQLQQQPMYGGQQQDAPMVSMPVPQPSPSPVGGAANPMSASAGSVIATNETAKTPSLQSNMFKMQRNRTLKKSYVDVFNPSGAQPSKSSEPILAPVIPAATVPQSGYFIPAPVNSEGSAQQQQQPDGTPQFYNPNQYAGYQ